MAKFCKWENGELPIPVTMKLSKVDVLRIINDMVNEGVLINNKTEIMNRIYEEVTKDGFRYAGGDISVMAYKIFDKYFTDYRGGSNEPK